MTERSSKVRYNVTYKKGEKLHTIKCGRSTIKYLRSLENVKIIKIEII
jgi:hypothetical protein